jgi:hypothetical protein
MVSPRAGSEKRGTPNPDERRGNETMNERRRYSATTPFRHGPNA